MTAKEKIVEAGIYLFNTNGYAATSIRDIANRAKVNSANISYYFKGKNGLLEHCIIEYFENYLNIIEKYLSLEIDRNIFMQCIEEIVQYHFKNRQLSRLVLREMSLDHQMIREVMATYLMKEKYIFQTLIQSLVKKQGGIIQSNQLAIILVQLKGLISAPFLNPLYLKEVLYIYPSDSYFMEEYIAEICYWMNKKIEGSNKKVH